MYFYKIKLLKLISIYINNIFKKKLGGPLPPKSNHGSIHGAIGYPNFLFDRLAIGYSNFLFARLVSNCLFWGQCSENLVYSIIKV